MDALTPAVFHLLMALADDARHGYAIMQLVQEQSDGRFRMGPGTLYTTIQRLVEMDWIEPVERAGEDPRRRLYQLTKAGRKALAAEVGRMGALVKTARKLGVA